MPDLDLTVPHAAYRDILAEIESDESPVGIDAQKAHIIILHKLLKLEEQGRSTAPMTAHVRRLFQYNDWANRRILRAIADLDDPEEALYLFSHIIRSQQRWLTRVLGDEDDEIPWFGPAFSLQECASEWAKSLQDWLDVLDANSDAGLLRSVHYDASEGGSFTSTVQEIVTQLNNHATHHRAQIAQIIREQGHTPPATDYIFYTRRADA